MHVLSWLLVASTAGLLAAPAAAQSTLDAVRKRGEVICGINGSVPGFSFPNPAKQFEGLDVDLCQAIAAAVLGSATKVKFVTVTPPERFTALQSGAMDVLVANTTFTLQRTAGVGVQMATVNYYDGQAFAVTKKSEIKNVLGLRGGTVCVTKDTTHIANLADWAQVQNFPVTPVILDDEASLYAAFFADKCVAISEDATALAAGIVRRGRGADHLMLPEIISKEPLGPYVRRGDAAWLDVVRWTQYAMIEAEELAVFRSNVDEMLRSGDPAVQRLLGVRPGNGKALGLDEAWAYNVIKQVGNYGESYDRHVGKNSQLGFARGINGLWNKGGLMYALPIR